MKLAGRGRFYAETRKRLVLRSTPSERWVRLSRLVPSYREGNFIPLTTAARRPSALRTLWQEAMDRFFRRIAWRTDTRCQSRPTTCSFKLAPTPRPRVNRPPLMAATVAAAWAAIAWWYRKVGGHIPTNRARNVAWATHRECSTQTPRALVHLTTGSRGQR
ncbi:MAG: hypothetical protein JWM55_747 [Acidimicrobiaceae bacterium]|nr:hypothetical protein [Acidimicrobiaceae bacterium]